MPPIPWRSRSEAASDQRCLVMASRLPLRSYWMIPRFLRLTLSVARQLERSDGLVGYSLLAQPMKKTFWTLSAWRSQQELDAFVKTMPHLGVMRTLRPHMGATRFTFWTVTGSALPISWDEAVGRLAQSPTSGAP
jgi:heme-degrading monooxygenase HmoA